jgi:hypothetical protein
VGYGVRWARIADHRHAQQLATLNEQVKALTINRQSKPKRLRITHTDGETSLITVNIGADGKRSFRIEGLDGVATVSKEDVVPAPTGNANGKQLQPAVARAEAWPLQMDSV